MKVVGQDMQGRGVTGYWDVSMGWAPAGTRVEREGQAEMRPLARTGSQRGMYPCPAAQPYPKGHRAPVEGR